MVSRSTDIIKRKIKLTVHARRVQAAWKLAWIWMRVAHTSPAIATKHNIRLGRAKGGVQGERDEGRTVGGAGRWTVRLLAETKRSWLRNSTFDVSRHMRDASANARVAHHSLFGDPEIEWLTPPNAYKIRYPVCETSPFCSGSSLTVSRDALRELPTKRFIPIEKKYA